MSVSALGSSALRIGGSLLCGAGLGARVFVVLALAGCLTPGWALAGGIPTLETVVVGGGSEEGLIGLAGAATEGTVSARQLEHRPLLRPAEVLELIPGLIVSQHSGDGKANQYYLRGFNLDHGTDFSTRVLGMPVNLPTHAHGQGYSDLQFLIPELVERMQYRKGPYAADVGDFAAAGSATIDYFRKLEAPFAQVTLGERGYRRGLLAGSPDLDGRNLLYALEWTANDGPWALPENLARLNGLLRLSQGSRDNGWSVAAMAYRARWNATDQVPQRAIDAGQIGRFGNLNATDGGHTRRSSLSGEWSGRDARGWTRLNAYAIDYSLDLWSDFSFCLNDMALTGSCQRGDQFHQADRRKVYGLDAAHSGFGALAGRPADFTLGVQVRHDSIDRVALGLSSARQDYLAIRNDKVAQSSIGLFGEAQVQWHDKFRSIVGLRSDHYHFDVDSSLAQNSGKAQDHITSPKLALILGPWAKTEYYANLGFGFHSNDARGTTTRLNPDPRDPGYLSPVRPVTPLVRARGYELGVRSAIVPGLHSALALWRLDLGSELVFVGDAGSTEPSFPSRRSGIEWANYWTPTPALIVDADLALSRARYTGAAPALAGGRHVPGALEKSFSAGATYDSHARWTAGLRLRYFGPRALVEDNTVRSRASMLVNARLGYRLGSGSSLSVEVLNLFDRRVSDIDYYYASQLRGEARPVEGIHTHPAEPRSLRVSLRVGY